MSSKNQLPVFDNTKLQERLDSPPLGEGIQVNSVKVSSSKWNTPLTEESLREARQKELMRIPHNSVLDHIWTKQGWEELDKAVKVLMRDYKNPSPYLISCDPIGHNPSKYPTLVSKWDEEKKEYKLIHSSNMETYQEKEA